MMSADYIHIYRYNKKVYNVGTNCGTWLMYNDKPIAYKPTPQTDSKIRPTIDTYYWSNRHKIQCEKELSEFFNCKNITEVQYRIQTYRIHLGML